MNKLLCAGLIALLALNVYAQENENTEVETSKIEAKTENSASLRSDKKFQVLGGLNLIGPNLSSATGLTGGYFLSSDKMLLLEVTSGSLKGESTSTNSGSASSTIDKFTLDNSSQSIGFHYKQFVGNSFYFRAGLDARSTTFKATAYNTSLGQTEEYSFKGTSTAANFQIGNQWQFDNFTIGCDWVGVSVPLSHSITDEKISPAAMAADPVEYQNKMNDLQKFFVKGALPNLLHFYLGASF